MVDSTLLVSHLHELLHVQAFQDHCPNGLQVEGVGEIQRVVTAVTASQAAIDFTVEQKANALLVHHGLFWGNGVKAVKSWMRQRLASLLGAGIHLLAYHLPLDCHPTLGNNVLMAGDLNVVPDSVQPLQWQDTNWLGAMANVQSPVTIAHYLERLKLIWGDLTGHYVSGGDHLIHKVAWCTGAAQDAIHQAVAANCDIFISGEASERTFHLAKELGIHFIRLGHHCTERYGVRALGEYMRNQYALDVIFFDEHNPF